MGLDALLFLVNDGPNREIGFEDPEGCLGLHQLQIELPELRGVRFGEIGAQQIPPFAAAHLSELVAIQSVSKACITLGEYDVDQPPRSRCLGLCGAERLHQWPRPLQVIFLDRVSCPARKRAYRAGRSGGSILRKRTATDHEHVRYIPRLQVFVDRTGRRI